MTRPDESRTAAEAGSRAQQAIGSSPAKESRGHPPEETATSNRQMRFGSAGWAAPPDEQSGQLPDPSPAPARPVAPRSARLRAVLAPGTSTVPPSRCAMTFTGPPATDAGTTDPARATRVSGGAASGVQWRPRRTIIGFCLPGFIRSEEDYVLRKSKQCSPPRRLDGAANRIIRARVAPNHELCSARKAR